MGPSVRIAHRRRDAIKRLGFWAVVIGLHGALVLLFSVDWTEERGEADAEPRRAMTVVFLDTPLESVPEKEVPPPPERQRAARAKARLRGSDAPDAGASTSVDMPTGTAPSDSPSIDWEHERAITAQAMLPELLKQNQTKCEAGRRPGSMLPKCRQPAKDPQWEPEPGRFGIEGLLPFMRLGKRCVVGLGFFGCAIGKLPEPNSHLFDEMRNPDREHSSVPEVDRQSALDP
jgi:hypothetical protein